MIHRVRPDCMVDRKSCDWVTLTVGRYPKEWSTSRSCTSIGHMLIQAYMAIFCPYARTYHAAAKTHITFVTKNVFEKDVRAKA